MLSISKMGKSHGLSLEPKGLLLAVVVSQVEPITTKIEWETVHTVTVPNIFESRSTVLILVGWSSPCTQGWP